MTDDNETVTEISINFITAVSYHFALKNKTRISGGPEVHTLSELDAVLQRSPNGKCMCKN